MHRKDRKKSSKRQDKFDKIFDKSDNKRSFFGGDWLRSKIGRCPVNLEKGDTGFKSILKKSVHLNAMRYRECLMEIAMLCEENSMENFTENLHDIVILIDSMSPTIVNFFENSFN